MKSIVPRSIAIVSIVTAMLSCSHKNQDQLFIADVSKPRQIALDEVVTDFRIIPLDESEGLVPSFAFAKLYGDRLFLHNQSKGTVTVFDNGGYLGTLKAVGRSNNEYVMAYASSYLPSREEILIYDIISKQIKAYHVPDMTWTRTIPMGDCKDYLNGFEAIDEDHSFYFGMHGAYVWDHRTKSISLEIPMTDIQADVSWAGDQTRVCEPGASSLTVGIAGYTTYVLKVEADKYSVIDSVAFNPQTFNEDFWKGELTEEKSETAQAAMLADKVALGCHAINFHGKDKAFWYFTAQGEVAEVTGENEGAKDWNLYIYKGGSGQAISRLTIAGSDYALQPDVHDSRQWGSIIELPLPEDGSKTGRIFKQMEELADKGYEHALLLYSVL